MRARVRAWSLLETMAVTSLSVAFCTFAGTLAVNLSGTYRELGHYADDLSLAGRQLDTLASDVGSAWRRLPQTPDGSLKAGPAVLILERQGGVVVVYQVEPALRPGLQPRLVRLRGTLREDLGVVGSLQVAGEPGEPVRLTLGLAVRGPGPGAVLSTAALCRARGLE